MAVEPVPAAVVTVFRSRLTEGAAAAGYDEWAVRMLDTARAMPGFVEFKAFRADDGERLSLVTFADWPSHDAWAAHPEHREAQRLGRERFYAEFDITVGEVARARRFRRSG